jgi:hypothetical protein
MNVMLAGAGVIRRPFDFRGIVRSRKLSDCVLIASSDVSQT